LNRRSPELRSPPKAMWASFCPVISLMNVNPDLIRWANCRPRSRLGEHGAGQAQRVVVGQLQGVVVVLRSENPELRQRPSGCLRCASQNPDLHGA
jgi:hypothetical protein